MDEEWKDIPGYEGLYQVSSHGNVKNKRTGHILKPAVDTLGYLRLSLSKSGVSKTHKVSRLVVLAFLPLVEGRQEVDHINRDRADNRVINLRWANRSDNCINRDTTIRITGHKYVERRGNKFRFILLRHRIWITFDTLQEAITARDNYLDSLE